MRDFEELLDFCFNDLPTETQKEIEIEMLSDGFLFDVISGIFRVKRELKTKEAVKAYFDETVQKAHKKIFGE